MFCQPDIFNMIPSRQMKCGMWHACGTREMCIWFWWGNLKETATLDDLVITEGKILGLILEK
jgi:hypothetical protein